MDGELVGAVFKDHILVLAEIIVDSAASISSGMNIKGDTNSPIDLLINHQISTLPLSLRPRPAHFIEVRQAALQPLDLDARGITDTQVRMEQRLELEFVRRGFLDGSGDLGFRARHGSREHRRHGVRRGGDGTRQGLGRGRVDDVDVRREFVLGQRDDVRQVERVREDRSDFRVGVERESDRDAFRSVHDDVFEGLAEALADSQSTCVEY
jgi:hypothetical protein